MGNSKSQITQFPVVIDPKQPDLWKTNSNIGYCDIVTNIQTSQIAQSYTIHVDGRIKLQKQYQIYEYRRTQTDNLVAVLQVRKMNSQYLCSGIDFLSIKTQRIHHRLSQINQLKFDQILYVIEKSLTGYKKIKQLSGSVKIDDNMIGITETGEVKVWLNENFAKNHPELENQFDQTISQQQAQKQMIKLIFQAVEKQQKLSKQIINKMKQNQNKTFDQALNMIRIVANQLSVNLNSIRINNNKKINQQRKNIQNDYVFETGATEQNESHKQTQNTEVSNNNSPKHQKVFQSSEPSIYQSNHSMSNSHQPCKNEINTKQCNNSVQVFTTYTDYKIQPIEMTITNNVFAKPPKPNCKISTSNFLETQFKMTETKRSNSKQRDKNYLNVQKIIPSKNPVSKSNSPSPKSSSYEKYKNIPISTSDQKFPKVKPYFPYEQLHIPSNSLNLPIVQKSFQTFNKPSSSFTNQPQIFIRNLSQQKLLKSKHQNIQIYSIPYTHQSNKIQQPLFASHHSSNKNIIITDFQKKIAILNQRIDLSLYKHE